MKKQICKTEDMKFVRHYTDRRTDRQDRQTDKQTYRSQVKGPIMEHLFNDVVIWSNKEIIPTRRNISIDFLSQRLKS